MSALPALDLNFVWFLLVGVLFTGYAILDGFDLGVGALHLFTKGDEERRIMLNAIGPVWDGNEVWLVTGGGALFAAFPMVYATIFSGFYTAFMLLLVALIFRAVAIEFRSKQPMLWWRKMWDFGFAGGSIFSAFIIGITMGNIVWGVPLDAEHELRGGFLQLIHPYSLLMGVTTIALFMMHGAIYSVMKTGGRLRRKLRTWVPDAMIFFIVCHATTALATLIYVPRMADNLRAHPIFFSVGLVNMLCIANIPRELFHGQEFRAFLSSCASMGTLMALFGIGMYPNLVFSAPSAENSLHIYNAASSQRTLGIMMIFALCGVPIVIAYTVSIYWIFRGKVKLDKLSY